MDTDAITGVMGLLAGAGGRMGSAWGAVSAALDAGAGGLGQGELGAAFRDGYQQPATATAAAVDRMCRAPGRLAEVGHECISGYRTADDRAGGYFPYPRP